MTAHRFAIAQFIPASTLAVVPDRSSSAPCRRRSAPGRRCRIAGWCRPAHSGPVAVPMQCVPWLCRSCTGSPTKLCVTIVRPLKSGCPRSMPVSSTATLMPAPLRWLAGTLHLIRPHVAPTTSGSSSAATSVSSAIAQVLRDRLRGPNEAAQIQAARIGRVREHEVLGLDGFDRAVVRDLRLHAHAARGECAARDHRRADLRKHQRVGVADGIERHGLLLEIAGIGDTQSLAARAIAAPSRSRSPCR